MPGICGLITRKPRGQAARELASMVETLKHESFYVTGTRIDESLGVYVGWTARSIDSSHGLPLCNERGDIELLFSGEEYPEPGIATKLRGRGHVVESGGSSHLVHLY